MENGCDGGIVLGTLVGLGAGCGAWLGFSGVGGIVATDGLSVVGMGTAVGSGVAGWGFGSVGSGWGGKISFDSSSSKNTYKKITEGRNNYS